MINRKWYDPTEMPMWWYGVSALICAFVGATVVFIVAAPLAIWVLVPYVKWVAGP